MRAYLDRALDRNSLTSLSDDSFHGLSSVTELYVYDRLNWASKEITRVDEFKASHGAGYSCGHKWEESTSREGCRSVSPVFDCFFVLFFSSIDWPWDIVILDIPRSLRMNKYIRINRSIKAATHTCVCYYWQCACACAFACGVFWLGRNLRLNSLTSLPNHIFAYLRDLIIL